MIHNVSPRSRPLHSRRVLMQVIAIFAAAIVLGVGAAYAIRVSTPEAAHPDEPAESAHLPPSGPFAEAARVAGLGTHRVLASTCSGTGVGTAFEFGPEGLLVTSARAVSGARAIAVVSGERVTSASVAKIDSRSGLALLSPESAVTGRGLDLGVAQLAPGDEAAVVGWTTESQQPSLGRLHAEISTVTEAGLQRTSPDGRHPSLRRMSGDFDPGLAGAPVIGDDGRILGAVVHIGEDQQDLLVAGLDTVADPLLGPTGMPPMVEPCLEAAGPRLATVVGGTASAETRTRLGQWFGALNTGNWDRAQEVLAADLRRAWSQERLEADYRGSFIFDITAEPVEVNSAGVEVSWVQLNAGNQQCERHSARAVVDEDGIQALTPTAPRPC